MNQYDNYTDFDDFDTRGTGMSFGALLLGMGIGAGLALLFAPGAGTDTRNMLRRRYNEALRSAEELRRQGAEWADKARDNVTQFARKGQEMAEDLGERAGVNLGTGTTGGGATGTPGTTGGSRPGGTTGTTGGTTTGGNRPGGTGGGTTGGNR